MSTMNQRVAHAFQKAMEMNDAALSTDQNKAIQIICADFEFLEAIRDYLNTVFPKAIP